ncbi:MAG TPA: MFS transporter [Baekduia sp.]|uniref:MFS transporter n=1 Tax=Baekduia sp. TaxID=2600305 RepID=UPI002D768534|nr:MFS transporter [Baekduia sp.]HET6505145.1 MFS transporter [Baekduia sp.]
MARFSHQPAAVWAVLLACVVAFMGIGLVDPILPIIADGLHASPSQVELLFTSYFAIIGVSNLAAGWVSSRIGAKNTMLLGLALVIVCSAAAGASSSVGTVVAFRAGWGLGIALFVSTSMSTIVGSARGGVATAVILFESALGIGIASGPLVGGLLGGIGWRIPFFGVAVLMALSFVSVATGVGRTAPAARSERISLGAPLRALAERRLLAGAVIALLYNFGFFMLLAYTPLPLDLGVHELGAVFFGWGVLVALGAIFCAPALTARLPLLPLLAAAFAMLAVDLLIIGLGIHDKGVMIVAIIASGLVLGIANAVLSNLLLGLSSADTSIAASGTNFVRFAGGAIAPFLAGKLSEHVSAEAPLYVGAASVAIGVVLIGACAPLLSGARAVRPTEDAETAEAWELELVG